MLDERSQTILRYIVEHYIQTAEPLGSRVLSKLLDNSMSAATIRNVMSDLTDLGLILQPHTSAGRIPADTAYRYYVDHLLNLATPLEQQEDYSPLAEQATEKSSQLLEAALLTAAEELSATTKFTGFILPPQAEFSRLKKIDFIALSQTQVLAVLVTQTGMIKNRILHFRECPTQEVLSNIAESLNHLFINKLLTEISATLFDRLGEENPHLPAQAIRLGKRAFEVEAEREVMIFGESNLCTFPEFTDQSQLQMVFGLFEDKPSLAHTLNQITQNEGVSIAIGEENHSKELFHCSVIASSYGNMSNRLGSIGIIGPTRMDYPKVISALNYSSKKLSYIASHFLHQEKL